MTAPWDVHGWKAVRDVLGGVHETTARRWARLGAPVYVLGRRVVARRAELARWLVESARPYASPR